MTLPAVLQKTTFPVIASPMFIISTPQLVIAQCQAGIICKSHMAYSFWR